MNILVIRFTSLGDLVTLEPAFRAFRHFFKNDKITLLTSGVGKGLFQDTDYFDEYVINEGVVSSVKKLRNEEFDLVINLQCNKPSHYISLFLNKKKLVNKSYSLMDKIFKIKTHVKSNKQIIESSGLFEQYLIDDYFNKNKTLIKLPVNDETDFITKETDKKYIAISTGTSPRWFSKRWGVENYLKLIKKLTADDYKVVLVGSDLELEDERYILNHFKNNEVLSFVNKTNLTKLKKLLSEVDLYIGNDSGPSHIAAGVSTNTITIFGSTDVKHCVKNIPYLGEHICLKPGDDIKCHPCYKAKCPTNMECMASISVDKVFNNVKIILEKEN
jgi:ADP-heptose:LPS heptosyltransferase